MIEIVESSPLVTVQDLGRHGHFAQGVAAAGAMDRLALMAGNALLGNPEGAAGIEIPRSPLSVRFHTHCVFALTGASCAARLDEEELMAWSVRSARPGQLLTCTPGTRQVYSYLTVMGGIDVPRVLGSRSTQHRGSFGGFAGRALRAGDLLPLLPQRSVSLCDFAASPPPFDLQSPIRVVPAAEYDWLTPASKAAFWNRPWTVGVQSNRAGYRLSGEKLTFAGGQEMRSHGIVSGVIQLPPSGQPVVQLADAATMGGYPKIGTVIPADLGRLAQHRPNQSLRFVATSYEEARETLGEHQDFCAEIARIGARRRRTLPASGIAATLVALAETLNRNALAAITVETGKARLTLRAMPRRVPHAVHAPEAGRWHLNTDPAPKGARNRLIGWLETADGLLPFRSEQPPASLLASDSVVVPRQELFRLS